MIEILKISLIAFMFVKLGDEDKIFHFYRKLICRLPEWLCRPLGGCHICFVGQACLWVYLLNRIALHQYDIFEHLFYVSAGILASMIYNKIYNYLNLSLIHI